MELRIERVDDLQRALALAPWIQRFAREAMAEHVGGADVPPTLGEDFLRRRFGHELTRVLVARREPDGAPVGLCVTAPFEDPLLGSQLPMIVVLWVEPELRHRGVARALVDAARARLAADGWPHLAGRAAHNDDALISMGERWGFLRQWEWMLGE